MIELFYANGRSASATLRAYKTAHNLVHDPFSVSSITRLAEKIKLTGNNSISNSLKNIIGTFLQAVYMTNQGKEEND